MFIQVHVIKIMIHTYILHSLMGGIASYPIIYLHDLTIHDRFSPTTLKQKLLEGKEIKFYATISQQLLHSCKAAL